jgi:hypothetical protein
MRRSFPFRSVSERSKQNVTSFHLKTGRRNWKQNEAKDKIIGSESKRKKRRFRYPLKRNKEVEAKRKCNESETHLKKLFYFHWVGSEKLEASERTYKSMRNGSRFASFLFEAK